MLSNDSSPHSSPSKSPSSPSFQLLSACAGKQKRSQHDHTSSTDSSSSQTVIRHTSSWGWVVVFGSFCVHFVADGLLFSFGILMHMIKDDLKLELHTVGIIASLFASLPLFLAPLTSAMVNKVGCRVMTMIGGFLCAFGLSLGSLTGNFAGALIGIGIICGIGLSCVYVPAVVIVAHYFDENRAIATAIAVGGTGIGNALVAQLIYLLNDYYQDWRDTTLVMAGVLSSIMLFGSLFRPVEFSLHRKEKHYHHTRQDTRLPPSCMTSMEKLQRFVNEMDKQCALRQTNQTNATSATHHERLPSTNDETDVISVANESDLFDSYSADDITEIHQKDGSKIDMITFREKIVNDMTFINERWKKITKTQAETSNTARLFRMPNFRYLISNRGKDRSNTLTTSNQATSTTNEKTNRLSDQQSDRQNFMMKEHRFSVSLSKPALEENNHKSTMIIKSEHVDNVPLTSKEPPTARRPSIRFRSMTADKQEQHLLQVYYQPINQKDIFYPGNVPVKSSDRQKVLSATSCPDLIQSYVYEESATSISSSEDEDDDDDEQGNRRHRRLFFYRKGLSFLHTLRRMLGLHLFRDYRYVLMFISQFLFYFFYDLIYLFPVDYGESVIGYSKAQMTRLVTTLGIGQFIGQLMFGLLANYSFLDELILFNIGAIVCGIASSLIPIVAYSYVTLQLMIFLFGLAISANYALTSIILANMCGLELLTSAYGLILLGQGLSSLFGPIVGGWIAERYGYKASLLVAGIFMCTAGLVTTVLCVTECIRNRSCTIKTKQINTTNNKTIVTSDSLDESRIHCTIPAKNGHD